MRGTLTVVNGEDGLFLGLTLAADEKKSTNQREGDQDEHQQGDQQIDHRTGETIIVVVVIVVASHNSGDDIDHFVDRVCRMSVCRRLSVVGR